MYIEIQHDNWPALKLYDITYKIIGQNVLYITLGLKRDIVLFREKDNDKKINPSNCLKDIEIFFHTYSISTAN